MIQNLILLHQGIVRSLLLYIDFHVDMFLKEMCMSESQQELSFQLFTSVQKTTKKRHLSVNVFCHVSMKEIHITKVSNVSASVSHFDIKMSSFYIWAISQIGCI